MAKSNQLQTQIESYVLSQSRNKIVIYRNPIDGIAPIDVGILVAESLSPFLGKTKIGLKAKSIVEDIFNSSLSVHDIYGKVIAISNLGILLEPELKLDIRSLFEKFSTCGYINCFKLQQRSRY